MEPTLTSFNNSLVIAKSDNSFEVEKDPNLKKYGLVFLVDEEENLIIKDYLTENVIEIPIQEAAFVINLLSARLNNKIKNQNETTK